MATTLDGSIKIMRVTMLKLKNIIRKTRDTMVKSMPNSFKLTMKPNSTMNMILMMLSRSSLMKPNCRLDLIMRKTLMMLLKSFQIWSMNNNQEVLPFRDLLKYQTKKN